MGLYSWDQDQSGFSRNHQECHITGREGTVKYCHVYLTFKKNIFKLFTPCFDANCLYILYMVSAQFRKCLVHLFTGMGTIPESHMNQTSERPRFTAESQTGEMSVIAARIPAGGTMTPKSEDSPTECGSFAQLPIAENKVCPM